MDHRRNPPCRGRLGLISPEPMFEVKNVNASNMYRAIELEEHLCAIVILATAPNAQAISPLVEGLAPNGKLLVPAAPAEPLTINVFSLIMKRSSVAGWYSGTARDSQDTLEFSALSGVHPMIEKYQLDRVADAYEQMHSGRVR